MGELPANLRCFIAVELPESLKAALAELQGTIRTLASELPPAIQHGVRWVDPKGIHITLKFLGNVPSDRLDQLQKALAYALRGAPDCDLQVKGIGMFPSSTRPRVIWVGVSGETQRLAELQKRVDQTTVPFGYPSEARAFNPHLTLARIREDLAGQDRRTLGDVVTRVRFTGVHEVHVSEVSLMRSELGRGGARYSRLAAVELI